MNLNPIRRNNNSNYSNCKFSQQNKIIITEIGLNKLALGKSREKDWDKNKYEENDKENNCDSFIRQSQGRKNLYHCSTQIQKYKEKNNANKNCKFSTQDEVNEHDQILDSFHMSRNKSLYSIGHKNNSNTNYKNMSGKLKNSISVDNKRSLNSIGSGFGSQNRQQPSKKVLKLHKAWHSSHQSLLSSVSRQMYRRQDFKHQPIQWAAVSHQYRSNIKNIFRQWELDRQQQVQREKGRLRGIAQRIGKSKIQQPLSKYASKKIKIKKKQGNKQRSFLQPRISKINYQPQYWKKDSIYKDEKIDNKSKSSQQCLFQQKQYQHQKQIQTHKQRKKNNNTSTDEQGKQIKIYYKLVNKQNF